MESINFSNIEGFEWNEANKNKNELKHGVTWKESEEVFDDTPVFFEDQRHSQKEQRFHVYGMTLNNRTLLIVFTIRGLKIRVISARDQDKKEKSLYKQSVKML